MKAITYRSFGPPRPTMGRRRPRGGRLGVDLAEYVAVGEGRARGKLVVSVAPR